MTGAPNMLGTLEYQRKWKDRQFLAEAKTDH